MRNFPKLCVWNVCLVLILGIDHFYFKNIYYNLSNALTGQKQYLVSFCVCANKSEPWISSRLISVERHSSNEFKVPPVNRPVRRYRFSRCVLWTSAGYRKQPYWVHRPRPASCWHERLNISGLLACWSSVWRGEARPSSRASSGRTTASSISITETCETSALNSKTAARRAHCRALVVPGLTCDQLSGRLPLPSSYPDSPPFSCYPLFLMPLCTPASAQAPPLPVTVLS